MDTADYHLRNVNIYNIKFELTFLNNGYTIHIVCSGNKKAQQRNAIERTHKSTRKCSAALMKCACMLNSGNMYNK